MLEQHLGLYSPSPPSSNVLTETRLNSNLPFGFKRALLFYLECGMVKPDAPGEWGHYKERYSLLCSGFPR